MRGTLKVVVRHLQIVLPGDRFAVADASADNVSDDNPTLMRLRELEVLEKVAANSKLSIVLGKKRLTERIVNVL